MHAARAASCRQLQSRERCLESSASKRCRPALSAHLWSFSRPLADWSGQSQAADTPTAECKLSSRSGGRECTLVCECKVDADVDSCSILRLEESLLSADDEVSEVGDSEADSGAACLRVVGETNRVWMLSQILKHSVKQLIDRAKQFLRFLGMFPIGVASTGKKTPIEIYTISKHSSLITIIGRRTSLSAYRKLGERCYVDMIQIVQEEGVVRVARHKLLAEFDDERMSAEESRVVSSLRKVLQCRLSAERQEESREMFARARVGRACSARTRRLPRRR